MILSSNLTINIIKILFFRLFKIFLVYLLTCKTFEILENSVYKVMIWITKWLLKNQSNKWLYLSLKIISVKFLKSIIPQLLYHYNIIIYYISKFFIQKKLFFTWWGIQRKFYIGRHEHMFLPKSFVIASLTTWLIQKDARILIKKRLSWESCS